MIPDLYSRKLRFGEIFFEAWRIYCRYFSYLIAFVLVCELIKQLLLLAIMHVSIPAWCRLFLGLALSLITLIGAVAVIHVAKAAGTSDCVNFVGYYRVIFKTYRRAAWVHIINGMFLMLTLLPLIVSVWGVVSSHGSIFSFCIRGFLLLVSVALFVMVNNYLGFAVQSAVFREKSGVSALVYSWRLVRGRWWYVLSATVLFSLPVIIILIVGKIAEIALAHYVNWIFKFGFRVFLTTLFQAYSLILFTIFFLNIDRENNSPDPVDPVIPSENSHETLS